MAKVDLISYEQFTPTVGSMEGEFVGEAYDNETMERQREGVRLYLVLAMAKVDLISYEQFTPTVGTLEGEFVGEAYDNETMERQREG
jgi:hypothetical protein